MNPREYCALGRGDGPRARAFQITNSRHTNPSRASPRAQRLPAYGRQLREALDAGYRPRKAGGGIIVTSDWYYARAFDPARFVCPPSDPVADYDFRFLRGCEVVVLVPETDELHGEALRAAIRDAGASLVVLAINREGES